MTSPSYLFDPIPCLTTEYGIFCPTIPAFTCSTSHDNSESIITNPIPFTVSSSSGSLSPLAIHICSISKYPKHVMVLKHSVFPAACAEADGHAGSWQM
jgi:hypothetical protein